MQTLVDLDVDQIVNAKLEDPKSLCRDIGPLHHTLRLSRFIQLLLLVYSLLSSLPSSSFIPCISFLLSLEEGRSPSDGASMLLFVPFSPRCQICPRWRSVSHVVGHGVESRIRFIRPFLLAAPRLAATPSKASLDLASPPALLPLLPSPAPTSTSISRSLSPSLLLIRVQPPRCRPRRNTLLASVPPAHLVRLGPRTGAGRGRLAARVAPCSSASPPAPA